MSRTLLTYIPQVGSIMLCLTLFRPLLADQPTGEIVLRVETHLNSPLIPIEISADPSVCKTQPPEHFRRLPDGTLLNIVAWLTPVDAATNSQVLHGYPERPEPELTLKDCHFSPRIQIVAPKISVHIFNRDPVLYHLHSLSKRNPPINLVLSPHLYSTQTQFSEPEIVETHCDIHPWAKAFVVVAAHQLYALTNDKGTIHFGHLPPGKYAVSLWHETLGRKDLEDVVVIGKATETRNLVWD